MMIPNALVTPISVSTTQNQTANQLKSKVLHIQTQTYWLIGMAQLRLQSLENQVVKLE